MRFMLALFVLIVSQRTLAISFSSTVHSIDAGQDKEPHLVRFNNGRAAFINHDKTRLLSSFILSGERSEIIKVFVDKENNIYAVQTVGIETDELDDESSWREREETYRPAVLKTTNAALSIFKKMRRDYTKNGECYNRAHIWAYEEHKRSGLNSMKIFMFFTRRYIRKYKFHWWFHVTPMFYVKSFRSPRTLDRRYTSGPRQTKTWSDVFVKSKRRCKKVSTFDDFWLNQENEDCYHIYASMYYVIPRDLEKRDLTGKEKTEFVEREIRRAYSNGFNISD